VTDPSREPKSHRAAFTKRTFSLPLLARSVGAAAAHTPILLAAYVRPATSRVLREKVMLAVTIVNDCRYCSWVHTGFALAHGVDLDELRRTLDAASFGEVEGRDAIAILYAKHFADTVRRPSAEAELALSRAFRGRARAEIMAYVHGIYFANLSGNSVDAWLARLRGIPVVDGHPVAEGAVTVVAAPILAAVRAVSAVFRPAHMAALTPARPPDPPSSRSTRAE
jgi:AhpD family alkylhydroperoxidase